MCSIQEGVMAHIKERYKAAITDAIEVALGHFYLSISEKSKSQILYAMDERKMVRIFMPKSRRGKCMGTDVCPVPKDKHGLVLAIDIVAYGGTVEVVITAHVRQAVDRAIHNEISQEEAERA